MINVIFIDDISSLASAQIKCFYNTFKNIQKYIAEDWVKEYKLSDFDAENEEFTLTCQKDVYHFSSKIISLLSNEVDSKFIGFAQDIEWEIPSLYVVDICLGKSRNTKEAQSGIGIAQKIKSYIDENELNSNVIHTTGLVSASQNAKKEIPVVLRPSKDDIINESFPTDRASIFIDELTNTKNGLYELVKYLLYGGYAMMEYIGVVLLYSMKIADSEEKING